MSTTPTPLLDPLFTTPRLSLVRHHHVVDDAEDMYSLDGNPKDFDPPAAPLGNNEDDDEFALPREALYGWAGDQVTRLGVPRGWGYLSLLTAFSAKGINSHTNGKGTRPTLYTWLMGPVNSGKSVTMDRVLALLNLGDLVETVTPASEPGLAQIYPQGDTPSPLAPYSLLYQDEGKNLLAKVNIPGSSLSPTLCSLFYKDCFGSSIRRGGPEPGLVRLSILAGVPVADSESFEELFAAEFAGGLASRSIFVPAPETQWIFSRYDADGDELVIQPVDRQPTRVKVTSVAGNAVEKWRAARVAEGLEPDRVPEIAMRVALISASANGDSEITPACIKAALVFAEWQLRVKEEFKINQALNDRAKLTNYISSVMNKAEKAFVEGKELTTTVNGEKLPVVKDGWVYFTRLNQKFSLCKKYGASDVGTQKKAMIAAGIIVEEIEPIPKGSPADTKPKRTGRVRLANLAFRQ